MVRTLSELRGEILDGVFSPDEWLQLDREVNEAFTSASEDEIQLFVDSGAGEMLDMICSAYRN